MTLLLCAKGIFRVCRRFLEKDLVAVSNLVVLLTSRSTSLALALSTSSLAATSVCVRLAETRPALGTSPVAHYFLLGLPVALLMFTR